MSSSLTTGGKEPTVRTTAARAPDNFIKKTKTRHKAGAASAHVCFHRQPGNKSSRHMKADSVVSCDGAKGSWYLDSLKIHSEAWLLLCLYAAQTHIKKKEKKNGDTLMLDIQRCVWKPVITELHRSHWNKGFDRKQRIRRGSRGSRRTLKVPIWGERRDVIIPKVAPSKRLRAARNDGTGLVSTQRSRSIPQQNGLSEPIFPCLSVCLLHGND